MYIWALVKCCGLFFGGLSGESDHNLRDGSSLSEIASKSMPGWKGRPAALTSSGLACSVLSPLFASTVHDGVSEHVNRANKASAEHIFLGEVKQNRIFFSAQCVDTKISMKFTLISRMHELFTLVF
jgi:hypothetical protein